MENGYRCLCSGYLPCLNVSGVLNGIDRCPKVGCGGCHCVVKVLNLAFHVVNSDSCVCMCCFQLTLRLLPHRCVYCNFLAQRRDQLVQLLQEKTRHVSVGRERSLSENLYPGSSGGGVLEDNSVLGVALDRERDVSRNRHPPHRPVAEDGKLIVLVSATVPCNRHKTWGCALSQAAGLGDGVPSNNYAHLQSDVCKNRNPCLPENNPVHSCKRKSEGYERV